MAIAFVSPRSLSGRRRRAGGRGLLLTARVALEGPRRRELAELVADHVLGHEQPHVLLAVMDQEGRADELGDDRAVAGPGLDRLADADPLDLREQPNVDVRAFFQGTTHGNLIPERYLGA